MSTTIEHDKIAKTLHSLNKTGTISYDVTLNTAIPLADIGLYQVINKTITELSSLKAKIKTNEKALIAESSADFTTSGSTISFDNSSTTLSKATKQSTVTDSRNRGGSTTANEKPAMLITSAQNGYAEDALFELIRVQCHDIMSLNNNVATVTGSHSDLIN